MEERNKKRKSTACVVAETNAREDVKENVMGGHEVIEKESRGWEPGEE